MTTIGDATAVASIADLKVLGGSTYPRLKDKMWYSVPHEGEGGGRVLYQYDATGDDEGNDTSIVAHSIAGRFYAFRDPLGGGGEGGGSFLGVPVTLVGVGTGNPSEPPPDISSEEMVYAYLRVDVASSSSEVRIFIGIDPTGESGEGGWVYVSLY